MSDEKRISEARAEARRFLRIALRYERGDALRSDLKRAVIDLRKELLRAQKALTSSREPSTEGCSLLKLARRDIGKMYLSPQGRAELKSCSVWIQPIFTSTSKSFMDYAEVARYCANKYPELGIEVDADLPAVVIKLWTGSADKPDTLPF